MAPDERARGHVRDELDVAHPGIAQHHQETIEFLWLSILPYGVILEEPPIYLPLLPWHRLEADGGLLVEIHFLASHILFDDAVFPIESLFLQFLQNPYGRKWRLLQPLIDLPLVWIQFGWLGTCQGIFRAFIGFRIALGGTRIDVIFLGEFCIAHPLQSIVANTHPLISLHGRLPFRSMIRLKRSLPDIPPSCRIPTFFVRRFLTFYHRR